MEDPFSISEPKAPTKNIISRRPSRLFWFVWLGVFCIALIIFVLFFWQWQSQPKNLMTLAPVDSILYANAKNNFWPYPVFLFISQKDKISSLPLTDFFSATQQLSAFSGLDLKKDFLANCRQASFILTPDENSVLSRVYIFEFKNASSLNLVIDKLKQKNYGNYFQLAGNILVISDSSDALNKVKEVNDGLIFSLASQVDKNRFGAGLLNVYLSSANLKSYLNQSSSLANTIFAQLINQDIYLQLYKKNQQWQFSFSGGFYSQPDKNQRQLLIDYLPSDYSFFVSDVNLTEIFSAWLKSDTDLSGLLKQTSQTIKQTYSFNFSNVADIFTNQRADLVIFENSSQNPFGFGYLLALPQLSEQQLASLKGLVKIILAQKLPKEVEHTLPDGSKVTELMAQPEFWQWQKQIIDNMEIDYLTEPVLNFEISYATRDNKLFISNSVDLLKRSLKTQDINSKSLIQSCYRNFDLGQYLIFNSSNTPLFTGLDLPSGTILIKEDRGNAFGCILGL